MFSPDQINVLSEYLTHSWLMRVDQQFTPLLTTPAEPSVVGRKLADIDHFSVLHLSILLEISPIEAADHWKDFKQHPGNSQIQGLAHYAASCGPSGLLWCAHAHVRMDSVDVSGHTLFTSALNQCKSKNKRNHAFFILNYLVSNDDFQISEQPADLARKFFDSFGSLFATHADSALRIANALIQVNAHHLTQDWIQHPHVKTARLVNDQFVTAPPSTIKNSVSKTLCVALGRISTGHSHHAELERLLAEWQTRHGFTPAEQVMLEHVRTRSFTPGVDDSHFTSSLQRYDRLLLLERTSTHPLHFQSKPRCAL